ncbi:MULTISPECIES: hypothetical protein [unclassified Nodosilinea]|uniref:Uncharacterized protein n=1 Tax=Leptolyngbya subtilissima DQ-A4 TaxID=2933933 RepID=A0ABV0K204_9CYAN|nr:MULTISPECIES: hypothetical protein [unclassified Nodosilinea]MBD2107578.1 hypothetical protein [Nodosilinea sp. FACHB-13]MBD2111281.1 hypothetical protein [Nodosilinea sp. FACHB-141]
MAIVDTSRRLPTRSMLQDIQAYEGLAAVKDYTTRRPEASAEALQANLAAMQAKQQKETELAALAKAAADEARQAEWEFHKGVIAMKENVRGTFGPDSHEAQAVGYKKKSERKRPRRRAVA